MMATILSLDTAIEQALYAARTPLGVRAFSLLTELGGGAVIAVLLICVSLAFWRSSQLRYVAGLWVSVGGAIIASELLKRLIERARPPVGWHAIVETGYSLPSNHATAAAALYGFLAYAALREAPERWRTTLVIFFLTIILLVGFSRLYLGVHYPTDVLGGFILGGLFVLVGAKVVQILQTRHFE